MKTEDIDPTKTDIEIKPQFYLHLGLIECQKALSSVTQDNNTGFMKYILNVKHLEGIAISANILGDEYDKFTVETDQDLPKQVLKAQAALQRITEQMFKNRMVTDSLPT